MGIVLSFVFSSLFFGNVKASDLDIYKHEKGQLSCVLKNSKSNLFTYEIKYDKSAFSRMTRTGEMIEGPVVDDIKTFSLHQKIEDKLYDITYPEGNIEFSLKDKKSNKPMIQKVVLLDDVIKMQTSESFVIKGEEGYFIECLRMSYDDTLEKKHNVNDQSKNPKPVDRPDSSEKSLGTKRK